MSAIRVVIADDHPIIRSGIRGMLETSVDILVVGEACSGKDALEMAKEMVPDVLLLDMELPDIKGSDVARQLIQEEIPVMILVLSAHDDQNYINELIELGVSGYLLKEEAPEFIVQAVKGVARGEKGWVSRGVAARIISMMRGDEESIVSLTHREMEVLRLITEGKTNQNIAMILGISEKTVEKYLSAIFQKLGVGSRTEAAVFAVREKLV